MKILNMITLIFVLFIYTSSCFKINFNEPGSYFKNSKWSLKSERSTQKDINYKNKLNNIIASSISFFISISNPASASESQTIKLFEDSRSSVVNINTFVEKLDTFSMNIMEVPAGTGSGFVWDKLGHIVTNYHVIRNSADANVVFTRNDGKIETFRATVTGADPDKDVAVLAISVDKGSTLTPIKVGSSNNLKVGQSAFAIGNPFGLVITID